MEMQIEGGTYMRKDILNLLCTDCGKHDEELMVRMQVNKFREQRQDMMLINRMRRSRGSWTGLADLWESKRK